MIKNIIFVLNIIAFISNIVINVEKISAVKELSEITVDTIRTVHKMSSSVKVVKLIGASAKDLASKIKDENVKFSGQN